MLLLLSCACTDACNHGVLYWLLVVIIAGAAALLHSTDPAVCPQPGGVLQGGIRTEHAWNMFRTEQNSSSNNCALWCHQGLQRRCDSSMQLA
jgi:hypothetical protein